ncbi:hypothetical protein JCM10213_006696 [Rhodosporidiobolus nylandii]
MDDDANDYNFDLDLFCPVCDRQIPQPQPDLPPPPRPPQPAPAPAPAPSLASTSASSKASSRNGDAPKMRRSNSAHSAAGGGPGGGAGGAHTGKGAALKRNKSAARLHTAHGAMRRGHSHTALHALAPLATAGKKAGGGKGKAKEEVIEVIEQDGSPAPPSATAVRQVEGDGAVAGGLGLYCSDECRRIDEARNALQLAHLTGQPLTQSPSPALAANRPAPHADLPSPAAAPFNAMARRRSSGLSNASFSSSGTSSYAASSSTRGVLSPILSAAPTANNPSAFSSHEPFPFPPHPPPPARSASAAASLPSHHHPYPAPTPAAAVSSLPPLHTSQQPPMLNFAARRASRGAGAPGYRPSLLERVASSDAVPQRGRLEEHDANEPARLTTEGRSLSLNTGLSLGRTGSTASADHLVGLAEREGRGGGQVRSHSALSGFRSMTPISHASASSASNPSTSPVRSRSTLSHSHSSLSARSGADSLPEERGREAPDSIGTRERRRSGSRSASRTRESFFVGSAPVSVGVGHPRRRGPSFGEPTVADVSSAHPAPSTSLSSRPIGLSRAQRSASSASLALMGTSLGRSYDAPRPWAPRRSESVASLSGFLATGEIALPSPSGTPIPPVSASASSTIIPASSFREPPVPGPASACSPTSTTSAASASSYSSRSQHSYTTRSGGSSTDLGRYNPILSTSASSRGSSATHGSRASSHAGGAALRRAGSTSRSRLSAPTGLLMTPSASGTNLAALASAAPAVGGSTLLPPSVSASGNPLNAASANPSLSYLKSEDAPLAPAPPPPIPHAPSAPPALSTHTRTLSHDQLAAPAPAPPSYPIYDVEDFRASRASSRPSGSSRDSGSTEGHGEMLPPPVPPGGGLRKERKRLFYFSEAGEG